MATTGFAFATMRVDLTTMRVGHPSIALIRPSSAVRERVTANAPAMAKIGQGGSGAS
ncbi:hypothetical protein QJS10_CPA05g01603 [Acorus calamus]|uniref:Uncharacterized protein n=1 Tax=Acorus calamus TaxID=4465 RepID=A0AAV9EXJ8_ACOCL|nr:hypothetical protein QJS10_CPA05g01603 [Acorus calamus]